VGDVVLVGRFANDLEAQAAAATLRDVGLHPVVLGRDPLAQLFDPVRAARLLVPESEREAAREVLASLEAGELEPPGGAGDEDTGEVGARPLRRLGLAAAWGILLLSAFAAPGWIFVPLLLAIAALVLLRR
jgi:hypothetical protein